MEVNLENNLKIPESVRGLTNLDKQLFKKVVQVPCLQINDVKPSLVLPIVKKYLLKLEKLKPMENVQDKGTVIYLNPEIINSWSDFKSDEQKALQVLNLDVNEFRQQTLHLNYENFSLENILRAVLPKEEEGFSSFTKIGHIVHINLREHLLPYKNVIGQVLYDKVAGCRTVVNKIDAIDNTYRNFKMEFLIGDTNTVTEVKENKCKFEFDFATVYWNSRLCSEHGRIVDKLQPDDVLFDVFAGVGPFSIPAAKKKCFVFANDLNPESFKWLNHNGKINKIGSEYLKSFNKDGKDFILNEIKEYLPKFLQKSGQIYIVMNLPALASQFLCNFVGLFNDEELVEFKMPPIVFVYCFTKGEDCVSLAKKLIAQDMPCDISNQIIDIFKATIRIKENIPMNTSIISQKNATMGKNKKKMNPVFKVAGAKSLKLKAKAKTVKGELKHINIKNLEKTLQIDRQLVELQEKIRQSKTKAITVSTTQNRLPESSGNRLETVQMSVEATKDLSTMKLQ